VKRYLRMTFHLPCDHSDFAYVDMPPLPLEAAIARVRCQECGAEAESRIEATDDPPRYVETV
jgi:hypothetical protein